MLIEILDTPEAVAQRAAEEIAKDVRSVVSQRGNYTLAVSGGKTPWVMLDALAQEQLPWDKVHILQVDERVAPAGNNDRNLTHILLHLKPAPIPAKNIHAMPVEAPNLAQAAAAYANTVEGLAGSPPRIDLVHLGMGPDGHTASLVPGDPVLDVADKDVAITGVYQDRQRMTLTYPVLNRARRILWLVTGAEKIPMLKRLESGDSTIPAGRIARDHALVLADSAAAPSR